jgi:hypothetical protein
MKPFSESGHFVPALHQEVRPNRLQGAQEPLTIGQQPVSKRFVSLEGPTPKWGDEVGRSTPPERTLFNW